MSTAHPRGFAHGATVESMRFVQMDGQTLDVVLQYSLPNEEFKALGPEFDDCSFRRLALTGMEKESEEMRRDYQIMTPRRTGRG